MSYKGRSLDDLPLAAYSTGAVAEEPEEEVVPETPLLSQQDAVALAMGLEPTPTTDAGEQGDEPRGRRGRPSLPRFSLPKPSFPKPSLPGLPRLSGGGAGAAVVAAESPLRAPQPAPVESPFRVAQAAAVESPFRVAQPAGGVSAFAMPLAHASAANPVATGVPARRAPLDLGDLGARLRNPGTAVRDPRVLFAGLIGIGAVVLAASLFGGGSATGGAAPGPIGTTPPGAGGPPPPGPATITVEGDFEATFSLTGTAAIGKPADGQLVATWDDGAGSSIALTGPAGSSMRTTTPQLVLVVTVVRNSTAYTFTSEAGECTVGMAEKFDNITGSFVCPEITSDGGRFTVKLTGTYST